jgi:predicted DNA-binding WGR domain protein
MPAADSPLHLERLDADRNMARFYALAVVPTLFGEWAVVREWGRIGSPGTIREEWFATEDEAQAAKALLALRKGRRGYVAASSAAPCTVSPCPPEDGGAGEGPGSRGEPPRSTR